MNKILKRLLTNEKGFALPLVLILLLLGGLIISPLLGYVTTGVRVGEQKEQMMERLYAADAGIDDAVYKIITNDSSVPTVVGNNNIYSIGNINEKNVDIEIICEEDIEGFLDELLQENYSGVHSDWQVVVDSVTAGNVTITVTYNGSAQKEYITGMGAWLGGDYEFEPGSASGITDDYPVYTFAQSDNYKGGTAFVWEWSGGNKPEFGKKTGIYARTLHFEFTPSEIPGFYVSWIIANQASIGVVTSDQSYGMWIVIATATNITTGENTVVTSYVARQKNEVRVVSWQVSP